MFGHVAGPKLQRVLKCMYNDKYDAARFDRLVKLARHLPRCSHCDVATAKKHHGSSAIRAEMVYPLGKLVGHIDLSGKKDRSVRGYYYFAVCMLKKRTAERMLSIYLEVFLLKTKDDIYVKMRKFRSQVGALHATGVAVTICDNDSVFVQGEGKDVMESGGVLNPASVESQFQNGVAESYIGIVYNLAVTLCSRGCVPILFWCFSVIFSKLLINLRETYPGSGISMHEEHWSTKISLKCWGWEFGVRGMFGS